MTTRVRVLTVLTLALAMMGLAGCDHYNCSGGATFGSSSCTATGSGLGGTGTGNAALAYPFFIDELGTIDGYTLTLSAFGPTTNYTAPTIPKNDPGLGMAVAANQFLYAVFPSTQQLYGWSIDSAGNLAPINNLPMTLSLNVPNWPYNVHSVITNPAGTLLFIANTNSGNIYVFQIGSGGALTAANGSPFSTPGILPQNMGMDGLGNYLYASGYDGSFDHLSNGLGAYSVSSTTGVLTPVNGSPFTFSPLNMYQIKGEATGKYLIADSGEIFYETGTDDNHLYVLSIGSSGAPTLAQTVATVYAPYNIAVQPMNPNGAFIYSFSMIPDILPAGPNPIEGYQLNVSTGTLTVDANSPFTGTDQSKALVGGFDPSGTYLFFSSENTFVPYSISSTGDITQLVPTGTFAAGYWAISDPAQ